MLPPFIIEQIRRREEEERALHEQHEQPRLEIPVDRPVPRPPQAPPEEKGDRGVVIIDL